ncbi:MAG TPA: GxxExxY protein [Candidatus Thermoplasmatota archaeon]|nr:GxxExxY protein [Candidatus Thermoplasmatota archaeon]
MALRIEPELPEDIERDAAMAVDVIGHVRKRLGGGLPERFYHRAMEMEFAARGAPVLSRPAVEVRYEGALLGEVFPDFLVGRGLVVELKAVETLHPVHEAQVLTYLAVTGRPLALLANLHAVPLGPGIRRYVRT